MSKKGSKTEGSKTEELIEMVQDDRVILAITTRMTTDINSKIETMFKQLAAEFLKSLKVTMEEIASDLISSAASSLNQKISELEDKNSSLTQRINDLENSTRLDSLIIYGLPEKPLTHDSSNDLSLKSANDEIPGILSMCRDRLEISLNENDIIYARRITKGSKDTNRPVLVKFATIGVRNRIYATRKSLRTSSSSSYEVRIYINEHLTKTNAHIFAQARKLIREGKIHAAWSSGGYIFIRRTNSLSDKPKKMTSVDDLGALVGA